MLKAATKSGFPLSSIAGLAIGVLGGGVLLLTSAPVMAQSTSADDFGNSDPGLFESGDNPDMFELMHRAQQGTIRNRYEFMQEQQRNILDEASDFRTRQQEALQQPTLVQPTQPAAPSAQPEEAGN